MTNVSQLSVETIFTTTALTTDMPRPQVSHVAKQSRELGNAEAHLASKGSFGSSKPCQITWSSFENARSAEFACTILCNIKLLLTKVYDPADQVLLMMRSLGISVRT